jgi:hypothetical protein
VLSALRAHTPTRYVAFATDGVQVQVAVVDQSRTTVYVTHSLVVSTNLYDAGAAPPLDAAVHVMAVPMPCGALLLAVSDAPRIGSNVVSAENALVEKSRTNMPIALARAHASEIGVRVPELIEDSRHCWAPSVLVESKANTSNCLRSSAFSPLERSEI